MQTLLDNDHKAISPFEEFPGFIKFPVMGLALYKRWKAWLETAKSDFGVVRFVTETNQEPNFSRFNLNNVDMLFEFAERIEVEGLDKKKPDNWPLEVVVWASDAAEEWLNSQISFRRYQRRGVVIPESGERQAVAAGAVDDSPVE